VVLEGRTFGNLVETLVESARLQSTTTPPNFLMSYDLHSTVAARFSHPEYAASILRTASRQCEEASGSNSGWPRCTAASATCWSAAAMHSMNLVGSLWYSSWSSTYMTVGLGDLVSTCRCRIHWNFWGGLGSVKVRWRGEDTARSGRTDCPIGQIKVHRKEMSGSHSGICHSNSMIMATKPKQMMNESLKCC
jgi:hypothetical protein